MTNYAVELKNVCKRFPLPTGGELEACKDINITLEKGESLGIVGESGSGKTTLVRMIMKMLPITEGEIYVDGHEVRKEPEKVREKIGFLTGDIKLDPQFSPDYMFDFFGKIHGVKPEKLKERKEELFTYFGIKDFAHKKMKELSTGMGQKAAIAVSLVHDPDIVIFDEPTNGLDVVTARSVTDYLKRLKEEGKLVIISTHIMSEAEKLCDRIGVIIDGRKVMEGHLEDILRETQTEDLEDAFFELYSQVKGGGEDA